MPYHIGNGVFGGLLPLICLSVIAKSGNIYAELYYPIIVAGMTFIVGSLLLRETYGHKIWEEVRANPKENQPTRVAGNLNFHYFLPKNNL